VNVVLATDIFDKELNDLRKSRWNKAFSAEQEDEEFNNLRATIVIEHIIQASDVSHTMQVGLNVATEGCCCNCCFSNFSLTHMSSPPFPL